MECGKIAVGQEEVDQSAGGARGTAFRAAASTIERQGRAKDLAIVAAFGMRNELETLDDLSDGFLHSFSVGVAKKFMLFSHDA
jgi:hypothetical protein